MLKLTDIPHDTINASNRSPFLQPESPDTELLIVSSGVLGLYQMDVRGQRQFVGLLFAGDMIFPGTRGACGIWPLSKQCEIVVVQAEHLAALPEKLWRDTSNRALSIAFEWLAQSRAGRSERVAHLLCEIAIRGGYGTTGIPNMFTQMQLADITGQTSVNVNRVLAELEREGLISRDQNLIAFRDWEGLRRLASFNAEYLEAA